MPSTPHPIVHPSLGPVWTPILQAAQAQKQKAANLAAARQQGNLYDRWFNCVQVGGSNLNQVVTIGAGFQQGGVQVWTGLPDGTAGGAARTALAVGTLTVTKGSTSATLTSTSSGTFTGGSNPIGVIDGNGDDVLTLVPGTTYTISGTAVTLSQPALESGTSLYCAACVFSMFSNFT